MRLIVTHPDNPNLPTAWSRAPLNLVHGLREQGGEVFPVTCGRGLLVERWACRVAQRLRGSDITYSPLFRLHARRKLAREVERLRPDAVIHCATTAAVPTGPTPVRHYLYCDSTWHRYVTLSPDAVPPSSRIISQVDRLERSSYAHLSHIFAFSTAAKDDLTGYFGLPPHKISVIGTGSGNVAPYHGQKNYGSGVILYVALRAPRQKGGELLLAAFKLAVARNPQLSLIMEGGSIPPGLAAGIPQVTLRGKSSREDLQQLFNSACLYAMPALFEPWGNVYIEALASRTPILGLNRQSLPDITKHGEYGFLVDEPTPEAVACAILDATSDPARLEHMGRDGQHHVLKNYTWSAVSRQIIQQIGQDVA